MMEFEDAVRVWDRPEFFGKAVMFVQRRGAKILVAKPVKLEYVEVDCGHEVMPTLVLSEPEAKAMLDELQKAGVRVPASDINVGKLQAMSAHLADLRQLLKLK